MSSTNFESGISPPHAHSSPFSISDILSKEIGQKKSPTSRLLSGISDRSRFSQDSANQIKNGSGETPKRPRKVSGSYFTSRNPKISLSEAGTMVSSGGLSYAGMEGKAY